MMKRTPKTPALAKLAMLLLFAIAAVAILDTTSISAQELGRTITSPFGVANPYMNASDASESNSNGDTFVDPETGEVGHIIRNPFGVANPEGVDTGIDIPDCEDKEVGGIITNPFGTPNPNGVDTGVDVLDENEEYLISLPDDEESEVEDAEDVEEGDDETSDDVKELEEESAKTATEKYIPVIDNPIRGGEYESFNFCIVGRCGSNSVTSVTSNPEQVPTLRVPSGNSFTIQAVLVEGSWPSTPLAWTVSSCTNSPYVLPGATGISTQPLPVGNTLATFQTTGILYDQYIFSATTAVAGSNYTKAIRVEIYHEVNGLKVYDPKLEDAGSAHYTLTGSGISKFVVENSSGTIVDTLSVTNDGHFSWNGRWGMPPDEREINTNYTGKFADPGKYTFHIVYPTSSNANNISPIESYAIYVVRLGVTEIEFQGVNPDEYFPLRFVATENRALSPIETDEGEQIDSESVPDMRSNRDALPQLNPIPVDTTGKLLNVRWRIGDDESGDDNADIIYNLGHQNDFGNRREHITPYVNYPQELDSIFKPPMKDNALVKGTWNLPVCYKIGSRIKIKAKTSPKAYSQVRCEQNGSIGGNDYSGLLDTSELGFNEQGRPIIMMSVKRIWENEENDNEEEVLDGVVSDNGTVSPFNILPGEVYTFRDNDQATPSVKTCVGGDTIRFDFTWKYQVSPNVYVDIPGKMITRHRIYSVIDTPKEPWASNNPVWIAVLHYASSWSDGATSQSEVADAITEHVNEHLGLSYSPYGDYNYTARNDSNLSYVFNCTDFLNYILSRDSANRNLRYAPNMVNCSDCANILTTFSNCLGSNLKIGHINNPHALNYIIPIGGSNFLEEPGGFVYHAFAFDVDTINVSSNIINNAKKQEPKKDDDNHEEDCVEQTVIWDACLKVAHNPSKRFSNLVETLPIHMPFNNSLTNRACTDPPPLPSQLPLSSVSPVITRFSPDSMANGTFEITNVYELEDNDGIIPQKCKLTYVSTNGNDVTFKLDCGSLNENGTPISILVDSEEKSDTFSNNGVKLFDYKIVKGTGAYSQNDKFVFQKTYRRST